MSVREILDIIWIPALTFIISVFYGIRLLVTKDPKVIRGGKDNRLLKDPIKYADGAGRILILFGIGSAIMAVLLLVNEYASMIECLLVIVAVIVLWKKLDNKYGVMD